MNNPNANAAAAAAPVVGGVPSFLDNPVSCLSAIANRPPSRDLWGMLSGTAASCMKDDDHSQLRSLYLRAVAQQLPASDMAAAGMDAVAAVAGGGNNSSMEFEMMRAQRLLEVLEVRKESVCFDIYNTVSCKRFIKRAHNQLNLHCFACLCFPYIHRLPV